MAVIDGNGISRELRGDLQRKVAALPKMPHLAIVLVGDDEESRRYVSLKQKAIAEIGAGCQIHRLSDSVSTAEVISLVENMNQDPEIHGILVQLPLPGEIDQDEVVMAIRPSKDVDGFHPLNLGLGFLGKTLFTSCAAQAVLNLASEYLQDNCPQVLLVGNSLDVIRPLAAIFVGRGCETTVVPKWRSGIDVSPYQLVVLEECPPRAVSAEIFGPGTLVIDAGFHWVDGKTSGNAATETFLESDKWLLPVPGGLGPLIITMLMANLYKAAAKDE